MGCSLRPRRGARRCVLAGALTLLAPAAGADVDLADYDPRATPGDRRAQASDARQVELDRVAEARRAAASLQAELRREAERRRLEEARPWPVRLTERRCTVCHAASNYRANGHTLIGWWVVAVRMRQVNGAPVSWSELTVIVSHLAEQYPARGAERLVEWGTLIALPGLITAGALIGRRWLGQRRRGPPRPRRG